MFHPAKIRKISDNFAFLSFFRNFAAMNHELLRQRFNPDGSLLRRQQMRMLEILLEVDKICKKHNIRYWLSSGTLIGAMRHDGFIPWDDDLDIEMMRSDYLRLMKVLPAELPEWLTLQNDEGARQALEDVGAEWLRPPVERTGYLYRHLPDGTSPYLDA